jgi:putative acetyltransferase
MEENTLVIIRQEEEADQRAVEECVRAAFWNMYMPGADEHFLAHQMRRSNDFISELNLVAIVDGVVAGSIMYTKSKVYIEGGEDIDTITFGPIAVSPKFQKRGIGQKLIARSTHLAIKLGYKAVIIFGDPRYYSKSGFRCAEKFDIQTASEKFAVCLLALPLQAGALDGIRRGKFVESDVFTCCDNESAVSEFDANFPLQEKIADTESQKVFHLLRSLSYHIA